MDSRLRGNDRVRLYCNRANDIIKLLLIIWLATPSLALGQEAGIETLTNRFNILEFRYAGLRSETAKISASADSLAREIKKQKKRKNPNLLQARALDDALKFSSGLDGMLETARREESRILNALIQFSSAAFEKLNDLAAELAAVYAREKQKNASARKAVLAERLKQVQGLRKRCQAYLDRVPDRVPIVDVKIESLDSPETASQKIDFMLDQADRLKKAAARAKKKIQEIRSVADLGARMSDFIEDLSLLDPGNERGDVKEPLKTENLSASNDLTAEDSRDFSETGSNADQDPANPNLSNTFFNTAGLANADFSNLSPEALDQLISDLRKREKLWKSQADSLRNAARKFRKWNDSRKER